MLQVQLTIEVSKNYKQYHIHTAQNGWKKVDVIDVFDIFDRFTIFTTQGKSDKLFNFNDHITGLLISENETKDVFLAKMEGISEDIYAENIKKAISKYGSNTNRELPISPAYQMCFKSL